MNPPVIHYVMASDGAAIAYTTFGEGPPLVYLQPYSNQQVDYSHPVLGPWYHRLSRSHTVVRLDARGFGLSERDPAKITEDGQLADVEAVVQRLGLEPFALVGASGQAHLAAKYVAKHPEQVGRLVLWGSPGFGYGPTRTYSLLELANLEDELFLDGMARWIAGDDTSRLSEWGTYLRSVTDAPATRAYSRMLPTIDLREDLPSIRCPTLVIHPSLHAHVSPSATRDMASRIRDCQFVALEARIYPHLGPDIELNARTIEAFVDGEAERPSPTSTASPARTSGVHIEDNHAGVLTNREREVLRLLAAGRTNREIAAKLVISTATVSRHVANIYEKLGVHRKAEAVAAAIGRGLGPTAGRST